MPNVTGAEKLIHAAQAALSKATNAIDTDLEEAKKHILDVQYALLDALTALNTPRSMGTNSLRRKRM